MIPGLLVGAMQFRVASWDANRPVTTQVHPFDVRLETREVLALFLRHKQDLGPPFLQLGDTIGGPKSPLVNVSTTVCKENALVKQGKAQDFHLGALFGADC